MAKLFKNSKQILALVMAFAVLAVSLFAGGIIASAEEGTEATEGACKGTRIEYWDGTSTSEFTKGEGTVTDPYVIENAKQLNWVCTISDTASEGKYYKVDPEIKAFILQPQAVVTALGGDSVFLDVASAAATKELFEVKAAGQTLKNWLANGYNKVFAGNFDGSGVVICGLYANDAIRGTQQCGLFPILDGNGVNLAEGAITTTPTVVKNFALKNSYFKGLRRVGTIASTSWYSAGGTKINGYVNVDGCEVSNCFVIGQDLNEKDNTIHTWNPNNRAAEMGVVFGSMGNDPVKVNNCSFYGNDSEYRVYGTAGNTTYTIDTAQKFNRVFSANTGNADGTQYGAMHNSIALDALVSGLNNNTTEIEYNNNIYSNVKSSIKTVTFVENGYGAEGQAAMSNFDWENDWFMGQYGPTLRAFHGTINLVQTHTTHYYECVDCGFKSYGGEVEHNWNSEYACADCGWQCTHGSQVVDEYRAGDCVTKPGYYTECNYCTWEDIEYVDKAPGHKLEFVPEIYANCEEEGRAGYYHCTVCNGNFTADSEEVATWAAMDTSIADPDTELIIPIAPHNATNRADGSVLVYDADKEGHWWVCYTCDGRLLAVESEEYAEEDAIKKHKFEDSVCVDCGWECTEHNYESTGRVTVAGSCTVDEESELKCSICGDKKSVVTKKAGHTIVKVEEVAATDKLEGTKTHYKCTVCQGMYTDAEGKNKATLAELIIPKTLPAGYENVVIGGGTVNTDTSTKSPATGDCVASVLAVAALAGATLIATRKIRK